MSGTMRAIAITHFGAGPEPMELPRPEPGRGEVLIRLAAAGLNPMDWAVADGRWEGRFPHVFPLIIGFDGAGTVVAAGPAASRFRPGDAVYGQFFGVPVGGSGSYAEYAAVPEAMDNGAIRHAPRTVPLADAAAVPTAAFTALGCLDESGAAAGQDVLIVGATGGVGCFLTQLAADRGVRVIATARGDAAHRMRALGADEVVDHASGQLGPQLRAIRPDGVDVLIDLISDGQLAEGRASFAANADLVRDGGTAVSIVFAAVPGSPPGERIRTVNYLPRGKEDLLERVTAQIEEGRLRIPVGSRIRLEEAPAALARSRNGGARGKTVIEVGH